MDVRTLCLGLLMDRESTGYEIQKRLKDDWLSFFFEASYGSIYPALNRLTEEGLVSFIEQAQDGRPDKKVYKITDAGREAFVDSLLEPIAADKFRSDFMARILFSGNLPAILVKRILDERIRYHETEISQLEHLDDECLSPAETFLGALGLELNRTALKFIRENRGAIERPQNEPPLGVSALETGFSK